jgi:hypothetical protein
MGMAAGISITKQRGGKIRRAQVLRFRSWVWAD